MKIVLSKITFSLRQLEFSLSKIEFSFVLGFQNALKVQETANYSILILQVEMTHLVMYAHTSTRARARDSNSVSKNCLIDFVNQVCEVNRNNSIELFAGWRRI